MKKLTRTVTIKAGTKLNCVEYINGGVGEEYKHKFLIDISPEKLICLYSINIPANQKLSFSASYSRYNVNYQSDPAEFYLRNRTLMVSSITNNKISLVSGGYSSSGNTVLPVKTTNDYNTNREEIKFYGCYVSINDISSSSSNFEKLELEFGLSIDYRDVYNKLQTAKTASDITLSVDFYYFE